ncbi:Site-specific recombinase XerD [Leeuwenhoekiella palythoae]|uniref:Site-specific recombinase XerD n=2 Tax=Leeuwenhoekiella palythoae TaxID=573501 RepID=A0A1M5YY61_9FLAO|nr:site-specific recombinase XerD [Leeuwenhoekiella palythoae]SHI16961.1 Site-specific recombinase XerD [Leeuwenhoekiella palythoae]
MYFSSMKPIIKLLNLRHRNVNHIGLQFAYHDGLKAVIKYELQAQWSQTHRLWYVLDTPKNLKRIYSVLAALCTIDTSGYEARQASNKETQPLTAMQRSVLNGYYRYLQGKRYSQSTIKTYTFFVSEFVKFQYKIAFEDYTNRQVELFIEQVFIERKYSISSQRQFISALKLFTTYFPHTQISALRLTRPKKSKKLPEVISQEQFLSLVQAAKNLKHRTIICVLYGSGLRISELLNLELKDLDPDRNQLFIRNAKGRKDRYAQLSAYLKPLLFNYLNTYKPQRYFIEGPNGKAYSASSVRKFLVVYAQKAGIAQRITPHILRHSYATHLLEQGVGIRHIQELLGHSKPETTMIYTHVTQKDLSAIKSPLDSVIAKFKLDKQEQKFLLSRKL